MALKHTGPSADSGSKAQLDQAQIDRLRLLRQRAQEQGKVQDFGFRNHATAAYVEALMFLAPDLLDAAETALKGKEAPSAEQP